MGISRGKVVSLYNDHAVAIFWQPYSGFMLLLIAMGDKMESFGARGQAVVPQHHQMRPLSRKDHRHRKTILPLPTLERQSRSVPWLLILKAAEIRENDHRCSPLWSSAKATSVPNPGLKAD